MPSYRHLIETPGQMLPAAEGQVPNNAGGYSWKADPLQQLRRFLILGSVSGTFYVTPRELTQQNIASFKHLLDTEGGRKQVQEILLDISERGLAPKVSPALFLLAYMFAHIDPDGRRHIPSGLLPRVARTASHLFEFLDNVTAMRGWGRGLRREVANWYMSMPIENLAYQMVKYRNRNGWTHADVIRLSHPNTKGDEVRSRLLRWALKGEEEESEQLPDVVRSYMQVKASNNPRVVARIVQNSNLPREAIPTEMLADKQIWQALLPGMPMTALIRNLGKLSSLGVGTHAGAPQRSVCNRLTNVEALEAARIHPLAILTALNTYRQGRGERGHLEWEAVQSICQALEKAFEMSFRNIPTLPRGKRVLVAVDSSWSMRQAKCSGIPNLSVAEAASAMARVVATMAKRGTCHVLSFGAQIVCHAISHRDPLGAWRVLAKMGGGTDTPLPFKWAEERREMIDIFVVLTDNETWAGDEHAFQVFDRYRRNICPTARCVFVQMEANTVTNAPPDDPNYLDVVGFDLDTPTLIQAFATGDI